VVILVRLAVVGEHLEGESQPVASLYLILLHKPPQLTLFQSALGVLTCSKGTRIRFVCEKKTQRPHASGGSPKPTWLLEVVVLGIAVEVTAVVAIAAVVVVMQEI
jgi:hypothetical protein